MDNKTTRRIFVTMAVGITVLYISIVFGCSQMKPQSGGSAKPKQTLSKNQRMKWWREARFGMFIRKLDTNSFKLLRGFITFAPDL